MSGRWRNRTLGPRLRATEGHPLLKQGPITRRPHPAARPEGSMAGPRRALLHLCACGVSHGSPAVAATPEPGPCSRRNVVQS